MATVFLGLRVLSSEIVLAPEGCEHEVAAAPRGVPEPEDPPARHRQGPAVRALRERSGAERRPGSALHGEGLPEKLCVKLAKYLGHSVTRKCTANYLKHS